MTAFDAAANVADTPNPREPDYRTHWYEYAVASQKNTGIVHTGTATPYINLARDRADQLNGVLVVRVAPDGDWTRYAEDGDQ